jgi:apolipoprotein N-acyltransferase
MTLTPEGELANTYLKSNPVPFAEQDYGSDDIMPVIDTPYGKLSPVICYDADFPHFMKQAGSNKTDILLIPSGDWKAIDPYHAQMAVLRGIENGVSIVRPVSRATSLATDPYGNIIAKMDFFSSADKTIIANVKTRGVATIYNTIGDVLPYLSLVLTAYIILDILFRAVLRRKKSYLKGKTRALEA